MAREPGQAKNYRDFPSRLNEAYLAFLEKIDDTASTPFEVVIETGKALEGAGLFVADPPGFDIAEIVDSENQRLNQSGSFGIEDKRRVSRRAVAGLAIAGVLDKEACASLVQ
jgi:hypothetical protein